ncbi:MAG: long-chain-acyl-CoA synthetase [Marinobacter sp.]|uniref:long-chain-acyl-CoA synthetase n=1 Tax=Marinobacter sp. TaxID=50741 RepID=UPI003299D89C
MSGVDLEITNNNEGQACAVPSREETQRKLDIRSAAAVKVSPRDLYSLGDRVEGKADSIPDLPFLVYGDRRYTYGDVEVICNQYANALLARGVKAGDVCAVALENRPELFFCWFALAKIGAVVTFVNYHLTGKPLKHLLDSTQAKLVLVGEECVSPFLETPESAEWPQWLIPDQENPATDAQLASFDTAFWDEIQQASKSRPSRDVRAHIRAEDPMLYIFTSGTTGLPKAAKYSHMRWMSSGDVMEVTLNVTTDDVFYCCLPLYHGAAATSVTSTALTSGASIVIRRKFSARGFWPEVQKYGVTVFQYIGEICRYLLNSPVCSEEQNHTLRCMLGAGLTAENWRRWLDRFGHVDVFEGWGATEANAATINVDNYIGSCGRVPDWNKTNLRLLRFDQETQSHVRDENGLCIHCKPGEVGEAVGFIVDSPDIGAGRFEGYTSKEATERKILRDVFMKGDAWWSSGDLLRYDENGYCYFVDRIGDTYRWKSENVSTQEVAGELGGFPGLELINVYGVLVPDHEGRAGMALLVMQPGHEFDPDAFFKFVADRLPHYARPVFVRVAVQADMTTTFKHRKFDLQKQGYNPANFDDPLYVKDDENETYSPYSEDVLSRNGISPFVGNDV